MKPHIIYKHAHTEHHHVSNLLYSELCVNPAPLIPGLLPCARSGGVALIAAHFWMKVAQCKRVSTLFMLSGFPPVFPLALCSLEHACMCWFWNGNPKHCSVLDCCPVVGIWAYSWFQSTCWGQKVKPMTIFESTAGLGGEAGWKGINKGLLGQRDLSVLFHLESCVSIRTVLCFPAVRLAPSPSNLSLTVGKTEMLTLSLCPSVFLYGKKT